MKRGRGFRWVSREERRARRQRRRQASAIRGGGIDRVGCVVAPISIQIGGVRGEWGEWGSGEGFGG